MYVYIYICAFLNNVLQSNNVWSRFAREIRRSVDFIFEGSILPLRKSFVTVVVCHSLQEQGAPYLSETQFFDFSVRSEAVV
jgi:hypothetical protein